ncbi:unnamed protein product [Cylindrotheca closterium]|uniref:PDZ domain-containing protein n=1 Tax=Cylindrotheca closterium TaxID=2856 RepID=A0AAD2CNA9_9STRA|nr:unnamed protein product [Cylindrotheca closterium]
MFKRLSSTKSTRKNIKGVVNEPPVKTEPVDEPIAEEKEPVSEIRAEDAPRQSDAIETMDHVISKAEKTACANDTVRGAMQYALAQGREGDAIDQVFSTVEDFTCAPENDSIAAASIKKCGITKFSQEEKVGISLRTSISTDGLYVNSISAGSKFESTELAIGQKVLKINGQDCPAALADAIDMLKSAESSLVVEVGPNDEVAKQFKEMGQIETVQNDLIVKKPEMTEIAVDGYADSCGFFWSLQNGLCALQDLDVKAIEQEEPVEEAPKEVEEVKPEIEDKALADEEEEEAPQEKKKKSLLKKPSLPSLKLRKNKSKKAVKEPDLKAEQPVEEAPKEAEETPKVELEAKAEEAPKKEENSEQLTEDKPLTKGEAPKEAPKVEEESKPESEGEALAEEEAPKIEEEIKPETEAKAVPEEEAPKEKKKKTRRFKAPSMPSIKLRKNKSKKVVEEPAPVETVTGEDGMMTIKFAKDSLDESVGLALRNSVLNDNIYVYGIFEGSKLKSSGLGEDMRVHSINGESFSNVEKAVKLIKEASELEIVAGPNDEPEETDEEDDEETEGTVEEEPQQASRGWFW